MEEIERMSQNCDIFSKLAAFLGHGGRCTGSWGILAWGKGQLEEVPVGGSASWGKCQLEDFNLSDFLGTIFILIHFYLMNATNEHYF